MDFYDGRSGYGGIGRNSLSGIDLDGLGSVCVVVNVPYQIEDTHDVLSHVDDAFYKEENAKEGAIRADTIDSLALIRDGFINTARKITQYRNNRGFSVKFPIPSHCYRNIDEFISSAFGILKEKLEEKLGHTDGVVYARRGSILRINVHY